MAPHLTTRPPPSRAQLLPETESVAKKNKWIHLIDCFPCFPRFPPFCLACFSFHVHTLHGHSHRKLDWDHRTRSMLWSQKSTYSPEELSSYSQCDYVVIDELWLGLAVMELLGHVVGTNRLINAESLSSISKQLVIDRNQELQEPGRHPPAMLSDHWALKSMTERPATLPARSFSTASVNLLTGYTSTIGFSSP